jgi:UDP-N-acetylglucosamine transferase subunit ALG13
MIFVTVGHQTPYDRLVRLVDRWAADRSRQDLFAQIGHGQYRPRQFPYEAYLEPAEFDRYMRECTAVVGHAGTGSIIQALLIGKPMLVLPRLAKLNETRNDHQVGTAQHFAAAGQILMARDDSDFVRQLDDVEAFRPKSLIGKSASPELISEIRHFVETRP